MPFSRRLFRTPSAWVAATAWTPAQRKRYAIPPTRWIICGAHDLGLTAQQLRVRSVKNGSHRCLYTPRPWRRFLICLHQPCWLVFPNCPKTPQVAAVARLIALRMVCCLRDICQKPLGRFFQTPPRAFDRKSRQMEHWEARHSRCLSQSRPRRGRLFRSKAIYRVGNRKTDGDSSMALRFHTQLECERQ